MSVPWPAELLPPPSSEAQEERPFMATQTEDDVQQRFRSLDRSLNRSLFLLLRRKNAHTGEERWVFPSVPYTAFPHAEGAPREAADRVVKEQLGASLDVHTFGAAPIAYHRYHYSPQYVDKSGTVKKGCKVFLFHSVLCGGTLELDVSDSGRSGDIVDWAWLTREQAVERVEDEELQGILLDVMLEHADHAEGTEMEELERRKKKAMEHYWEPPAPAVGWKPNTADAASASSTKREGETGRREEKKVSEATPRLQKAATQR